MSTVSALTVYAIRRFFNGNLVDDFKTVINPTKLVNPSISTDYFEADDQSWSAQLYMWPGESKPPTWLSFLQSGFDPDLELPDSAQSSAVIVVKVSYYYDRYYAITFGGGRHYLQRGIIDRRYGIQVALNAIYEGDKDSAVLSSASRVQQVNSRTVGANTMRILRQTNRHTEFDVFELDPDGDQLDGITGRPVSENTLGRRIRGTDSVRLGLSCSFDDLGDICVTLARYHAKTDYQRRFSFVDSVTEETNLGQIEILTNNTFDSLLDDPTGWVLAPPALIDFDEVDKFSIPDLNISASEITSSQLINALEAESITSVDEFVKLTLEALDQNDHIIQNWPILECLDGQISLNGDTYLANEGCFYKVSGDYLEMLDNYIGSIQRTTADLPDSVRVPDPANPHELKEITEGEYNQIAADHRDEYILLDKELVSVSGKTSRIEICDVLTSSRQLIHIKRKFSSSSLSHLFAQGYVSSELLLDSQEYRQAIREKIGPQRPAFRNLFPVLGLLAGDYEIVYGIIGDWTNKNLTDIPFFSKVNLRKYRRALKRLQFLVTYAPIQVVDP